jgi:hypothetical protein
MAWSLELPACQTMLGLNLAQAAPAHNYIKPGETQVQCTHSHKAEHIHMIIYNRNGCTLESLVR